VVSRAQKHQTLQWPLESWLPAADDFFQQNPLKPESVGFSFLLPELPARERGLGSIAPFLPSADDFRGRDASYLAPTGSREAVARLPLPQNVACGFTALRSSAVGSQHC
jgi:hypothetical protein